MLIDTEKSLKAALEETKTIALEVNKKEIDYNKLKREADNNASLYGMILKRLKETDLTGMLKSNNVRRLDNALVPKVSIKPRVKFNILIAMLIGFIGGLGLAFFFEYLDNTIKTQEDIERVLGLTFLGFIPTIVVDEASSESDERVMKDLYLFSHPKSNAAEACRSIRTNIMFVTPDKPARTLLFTSAGPQEGKSITATSVAISMALSGNKTILIDGDMRKPRIHRSFGLENISGLSSCIIGGTDLDSAIQSTTVPNLHVLPCGPIPPNPAELLHTEGFKSVLTQLMNKYDKVIFDSPPVIAVTDAVIMSRMMDGVILVIKSAKTSRDMARIIGSVLNDLDFEDRGYRYYYYYYYRRYGYYYGEKGEKEKRKSSRHA
jgi:capsular exopolysaccharide synthesis family protein